MAAENKSGLNWYCIAIDIILLFDCVYKLYCKEKQLKIKKGCLKYDIQLKKTMRLVNQMHRQLIKANETICLLFRRTVIKRDNY